ncbi:TrkH family potassium uptake protein [Fusicatenibacter sp.]
MIHRKDRQKRHMSSFKMIILGFMGVILAGALLLMLPIASKEGKMTPFPDTLFTATSAVCVTGLAVKDTGSYWSQFGQAVILALIQIGGLGVVTIAVSIAMLSGRKISLMQRSTMQDAISAPKVGGIVRLTRFILKGTFLVELSGAMLLLPVFFKDYGAEGIWMAFFHSISAFCNAGFDLLGKNGNLYPSLTAYADNPLLNVTIMGLIVIGGIGFLTWDDIHTRKFRIRQYSMQSKVILLTSSILILVPAVFFYFTDFAGMSRKERLLASLFQSVTTRTAGFNTENLSAMSGASKAVMVGLMMIGGAPGSTAGGLKTTTFAVLLASTFATFRQREDTQLFRRRIEREALKNAAALLIMYLFLVLAGGIIISECENLSITECLYETASAVGTVGLTLGITPGLGVFSKGILIVLMFLGRVGGLTLVYAVLPERKTIYAKLPLEKINIG